MLTDYGHVTVPSDWKVDEKAPCGSIRVYDVYGGNVIYHDETTTQKLEAGKIYMFPSSKPYRMENDVSNPLECTFLHLQTAPFVLHELKVLSGDEFSRLIFDALKISVQDADDRITILLSQAFEEYCKKESLFTMTDEAVAAALERMTADFCKKWTTAELCALCGYSEHYFIRRFTAETGISPHQYLILLRMREAKRMLRGADSISKIAEKTGYIDSKAFIRAFKKRYGVSPDKYRRSKNLKFNP